MRASPRWRVSVIHVTLLAIVLSGLAGCSSTHILKRELVAPESAGRLDSSSEYLKAHMLDGQVYLLSAWTVDEQGRQVNGQGVRFDAYRDTLAVGPFRVPLDSVAVFETNLTTPSASVAAMSVVTGASVAMTVYCAANPKACFGSCPTFYIDGDPDSVLQAEGFSSSVAPALEATDVDALYRARATGSRLDVRMVNEALETHVIRHADLLVAARPPGGRVLATPEGRFREAFEFRAPGVCRGPEGDCRAALLAFDGRERTSPADSTDLAAKESIELEFSNVPDGELGLVIAGRQSLMSTFLFYQLLAYLGSRAGEYLAALERGDASVRTALEAVGAHIGGVTAEMRLPSGRWVPIGASGEVGPLATEVKVLPFVAPRADTLHVRLRLTRGNWRLDQVALALLGGEVRPQRLRPVAVFSPRSRTAGDPAALAALLDSSLVLTTLPGDTCRLRYDLPEGFDGHELFLETRGYYLEWMRDEWLAEENAGRALAMLLDPGAALRALAPEYKRIEARMDAAFWRSRYAK